MVGVQGRPVLIIWAARHDMSARNLAETQQLIVYTLDNTLAAAADLQQNPLGQFLCLFDLSGMSPYSIYFPEYVASGCRPQGISWLPSNGFLKRLTLASARLCHNYLKGGLGKGHPIFGCNGGEAALPWHRSTSLGPR